MPISMKPCKIVELGLDVFTSTSVQSLQEATSRRPSEGPSHRQSGEARSVSSLKRHGIAGVSFRISLATAAWFIVGLFGSSTFRSEVVTASRVPHVREFLRLAPL